MNISEIIASIKQNILLRLTLYFLQSLICIFLAVFISTYADSLIGDEVGLTLLLILIVFCFNICFSFIYFRTKNRKILHSLIVTLISTGLTIAIYMLYEIGYRNLFFKIFGDLSLQIVFISSSILSWELIDKYLSKRELSNQEDSTSSL